MGQFTDKSNGTIHGQKQWDNSRIEAMGQFTDRSNRDREETMAIINQEKATINEKLAHVLVSYV